VKGNMNLNSWDYDELDKEMRKATPFQLLQLYKRENKKYTEKCVEYANRIGTLTPEGITVLEKECEFLNGARIKVALKIAEELTKS